MYIVRTFHELIGDHDFNATNLLISRDCRIWMIDFSRAFRLAKRLQRPNDLPMVDPRLLANLRRLIPRSLRQRLERWLTTPEIEAVLARRDRLVRISTMLS